MDIIGGIFQSLDFASSAALRNDRYKHCKNNNAKWSSLSGSCKYNDKKQKTKKKKGGTKRKIKNKNKN